MRTPLVPGPDRSGAPTLTVWLNGSLVAPVAARIDPADRGFLLGDGLFETMRAQDGRVLRPPPIDRDGQSNVTPCPET